MPSGPYSGRGTPLGETPVKTFVYSTIPTKSKFQADSSVTFAIRSSDRILTHIDWLLERYEHWTKQSDGSSLMKVILADLALTGRYWVTKSDGYLKSTDSHVLKNRYPVVKALLRCAEACLCQHLGVTALELDQALDEMFGRQISGLGASIDNNGLNAQYLDATELELCKVRFRGGLAYQSPWWQGKRSCFQSGPMLAESKRAYVACMRGGNASTENYGAFVMTLDRTIYMRKHALETVDKPGLYHSAYTRGGNVTMAGTMLIEKGRVLAVRNDSGHYMPTVMNMTFFLQALGMYGVNLSRVSVFSYEGTALGSAMDFLKTGSDPTLSWAKFEKQMNQELSARGKAPRALPGTAPGNNGGFAVANTMENPLYWNS